ncbi:amino acid ABC transporter substrate-binding protein [Paenibacillus mucilaginosus]|uniref:Amino acid ABC transporter n=3 Tax=Paenibacillus mucilaginosus TaxID=61624 RepID=H6NKG1_9BACL|nr:amino acid ABC transporter substrate-binding protein [Paenibacillus mucilaginosus]AEI44553.1 amino acid ABC transporter [Paenibacillus mucilaginosus KNP414]AFC32352.1 amino acid ABC transporter [Paenibacillus mucilaginosus 3016]AFH64660.1 amino acid ABC transporter substrate-binding protein [Paenibacillus mucilaginosus K02]MCG7218113.1 amino acid ABC transporter substrate-binding protein [Paenibacillus mucilaginosus]WDM26132.1 amino acid ABC transporter substrate-binding protein [Paenibacil
MTRRWTSIVLLFAVLTLLIAACGTKNPAPNGGAAAPEGTKEGAAPAAGANLLETVKSSGKLRVGTEGTYAPFTYHDKDGKLTGFDVEIAEEVAKRLGVQAEFIETKWDGMFAGLDAKRFDLVANQVSIKEDRKVKYDFSDPYIVSKAVLIVHNDNQDIKSLADLKGKKAGQSLTSNLTEIAKANGAEIVQIDGFNQAIDLLLSKRIDATINDGLSYLDLKKQKPDVAIKVVDETKEATPSALLLNKNNPELLAAVNKALADMKSDGTYLKISEKYFGQDVSK